MSERFFSGAPIQGPEVELTGSEAHHLARVLRAELGRQVVLFDGLGAEFEAVVESVGRHAVRLRVVARRERSREWPLSMSLAVALPKGERQRWLVEKCVELGLSRLVPLRTARGTARPTDAALERLRRAVVEASKQCGRNRLMAIDPPRDWLEWAPIAPARRRRLIAEPGAADWGAWLPNDAESLGNASQSPRANTDLPRADVKSPYAGGDLPRAKAELVPAVAEDDRLRRDPAGGDEVDVQLAIGPEGGWTDEERAAARAAGWHAVDLGPTILRVETAAVAMVAQLAAEWRLRR